MFFWVLFFQILHDIVPSHELMIDFNTMLQKSSKSLNIFVLFLYVNLESCSEVMLQLPFCFLKESRLLRIKKKPQTPKLTF